LATLAILANPANEAAGELAKDTATWAEGRGHLVRSLMMNDAGLVTEDGTEEAISLVQLGGADLAVSLGGDGTFLQLIPLAYAARVPILGVNLGRLGYLLPVQPQDLHDALETALSGDYVPDDRDALMIEVSGGLTLAPGGDRSVVERGSGTHEELGWLALNEVVVQKTLPGHTVRLATAIDEEPFLSYAADGILVATPTGSTAYNLSAGGPVVSPRLRSMLLTPIAPHLGFDRSVVLDADQEIRITVLEERPAVLVIDGLEVGRLQPGAELVCRVAPRPVRFVSLKNQGFGSRLRATLAGTQDL